MPSPNSISGRETLRSNYKIGSPSSTRVPVLRVYTQRKKGTKIVPGHCTISGSSPPLSNEPSIAKWTIGTVLVPLIFLVYFTATLLLKITSLSSRGTFSNGFESSSYIPSDFLLRVSVSGLSNEC